MDRSGNTDISIINFDQVPAAVVSGLGPSSEICSAKLGNTTGNLMAVAELVGRAFQKQDLDVEMTCFFEVLNV